MALPSFLVIGASRAGTTSLWRWLGEHPEIFVSPIKETNYFAHPGRPSERFPVTTPEAYERLFAAAGTAVAVGEVSPIYLSRSALAAERIRRALPAVRLVASLRHPADRAFSNYLLQVQAGRERRTVREAFEHYADYVREGGYYERLRDFYDRFEPDRIRILLFDDLLDDAPRLLRDLFAFLGVDASFEPDTSVRHNPGGVPRRPWLHHLLSRSRVARAARRVAPAGLRRAVRRARDLDLTRPPELPADLRARLVAFYRHDVERTQELVGRDLSHWLV
jgi:hypothetical protein